jgi:hypothetical protein
VLIPASSDARFCSTKHRVAAYDESKRLKWLLVELDNEYSATAQALLAGLNGKRRDTKLAAARARVRERLAELRPMG